VLGTSTHATTAVFFSPERPHVAAFSSLMLLIGVSFFRLNALIQLQPFLSEFYQAPPGFEAALRGFLLTLAFFASEVFFLFFSPLPSLELSIIFFPRTPVLGSASPGGYAQFKCPLMATSSSFSKKGGAIVFQNKVLGFLPLLSAVAPRLACLPADVIADVLDLAKGSHTHSLQKSY